MKSSETHPLLSEPSPVGCEGIALVTWYIDVSCLGILLTQLSVAVLLQGEALESFHSIFYYIEANKS